LILYFKLLGIEKYFLDSTSYASITEIQKAQALLLIRQNLTSEPLSLIFDESDPFKALGVLSSAFQGTGPVLRQQLYLEFHSMKFEDYRSLNGFISAFKSYISKLSSVGAKIDDIDQKTIFIAALAREFPVWADRQRSALRLNNPPSIESIITDILDENRRSEDTPMGNSYYVKSSKNRRFQNSKSGSYRSKNHRETGNNSKDNSESQKPRNPNNGKSNRKDWNNSNKRRSNNPSNSKRNDRNDRNEPDSEDNFFNFTTLPPTSKKLTTLPRDWWLYDTGSSRHISNNKYLFDDLELTQGLRPILTGGGAVYPMGEGNITLPFFVQGHGIRKITLNNVLYVPDFPINIMSGQLHYRKGGIISGNKLLDSKKQPFSTLNHSKRGFFLNVAYKSEPDISLLAINPSEILNKVSLVRETDEIPSKKQDIETDSTISNVEIDIPSDSVHYTTTEKWHKILGHPSFDILRSTAKATTGIPITDLNK
jgi:hypothetical protein